MSKSAKVRSVVVVARRWFHKGQGNTYHSAEVTVNGEPIGRVGFTYGYGDHYLQTAADILHKNGVLTDVPGYMLTRYCREHGIDCTVTVSDVARKKDL